MNYRSANSYYREVFGDKVYRIALDAGCTCPNRDGTKGTRGCIFCSGLGSGEFAADRNLSISEQLSQAKEKVRKKTDSHLYIAYFQNFSNTYGDEDVLSKKYEEAISDPEVVGLAIATRPDVISEKMYKILSDLSEKTHVWIELGLQTIHEDTAKWMRRGYALSVFEETIRRLKMIPKLQVIVHVIMDFPCETKKQMLETIDYCARLPIHGIKIANLNILRGTDLGTAYEKEPFPLMERDEYIAFIGEILPRLSPEMVVYRLTGDGAKRDLLAPLWVSDKRRTRNELEGYLRAHQIRQGSAFSGENSY